MFSRPAQSGFLLVFTSAPFCLVIEHNVAIFVIIIAKDLTQLFDRTVHSGFNRAYRGIINFGNLLI